MGTRLINKVYVTTYTPAGWYSVTQPDSHGSGPLPDREPFVGTTATDADGYVSTVGHGTVETRIEHRLRDRGYET